MPHFISFYAMFIHTFVVFEYFTLYRMVRGSTLPLERSLRLQACTTPHTDSVYVFHLLNSHTLKGLCFNNLPNSNYSETLAQHKHSSQSFWWCLLKWSSWRWKPTRMTQMSQIKHVIRYCLHVLIFEYLLDFLGRPAVFDARLWHTMWGQVDELAGSRSCNGWPNYVIEILN